MSRHRNAYDKDELLDYDDYDYDDYDYDDYDSKDYRDDEENQLNCNDEVPGSTTEYEQAIDPEVAFQFVIESINDANSVVKVSETRVRQILESYDYNVLKTIEYFQLQKSSGDKKKSNKISNKSSLSSNNSNNSSVLSKVSPHVNNNGSTKQLLAANIPSKASMQTDLAAIGLDNFQYKEISSDDDLEDNSNEALGVDQKATLTVVVAGHVDAGKSTLVGNLLKITSKYNVKSTSSQNSNSKSIPLAWMTDESSSEREHGVTIDYAERQFQTERLIITIVDCPGHRDFIPNMISGAALTDVAILVVPGNDSEYESATSKNAQTREHAVLLKSMGVNQIIVAVNKLDSNHIPWDQERFQMISNQMRSLLIALRFKSKAIHIIPISGLLGENLDSISSSSPLRQWYQGPTLLSVLDSLHVPKRLLDKPTRAIIKSYREVKSNKGILSYELMVKILQGKLLINRSYNLTNLSSCVVLQNITLLDGSIVTKAPAGSQCTIICIKKSQDNSKLCLYDGQILFKGLPMIQPCSKFKATIITLENICPIIVGMSFELYLQGEEVECQVTKFYRVLSKQGVIKYPKIISSEKTASIRIETSRDIYIEQFTECNALGRFALRSKGRICAVGVISKLPNIL